MRVFGSLTFALWLVCGAAPAAWGQAKPAAPPPVGAEPGQTTATYGDWTLRCELAQTADKPRHLCEVMQVLRPQNQQAPIAQIAFGKVDSGNDLHVVAVLPVNIVLPSSVKIGLDDKDPRPADLVWRRCLPGGCFADAVATEDLLGRWRSATGPGRLTFKDAANRDIAVALPLRGLGQALDAMTKQ